MGMNSEELIRKLHMELTPPRSPQIKDHFIHKRADFKKSLETIMEIIASVPLQDQLTTENKRALSSKIKDLWQDRLTLAMLQCSAETGVNMTNLPGLNDALQFNRLSSNTLEDLIAEVQKKIVDFEAKVELFKKRVTASPEAIKTIDLNIALIKAYKKGLKELVKFTKTVDKISTPPESAVIANYVGAEATGAPTAKAKSKTTAQDTLRASRELTFKGAGVLVGTVYGAFVGTIVGTIAGGAAMVAGAGLGAYNRTSRDKGLGNLIEFPVGAAEGVILGAIGGVAVAGASVVVSAAYGKHLGKRAADEVYDNKCRLIESVVKLNRIVRKYEIPYGETYKRSRHKYVEDVMAIEEKHKRRPKR